MHHLPNAYADINRLRTVAATLGISLQDANQAFAQYVPRDAIEADMVEQILYARARISAATARVLAPDLSPQLAARIDRTLTSMTRQLATLIERLELRQNRPTWNLPQQYWRPVPIEDVGPFMEKNPQAQEATTLEATTPPELAPEPVAHPKAEPPPIRWTDAPEADTNGDDLARLAAMRFTADGPLPEVWAAQRDPEPAPTPALNRSARRALERRHAA